MRLSSSLILGFVLVVSACSTRPGGPEIRNDGGPTLDAATGDAGACDGARTCGETCCGAGEVCTLESTCCAREDLCGSTCCGAGQVCEGAVCHNDCGENARCQNDAGGEFCCAAGEVCALDRCFMPTTSCTDFYDCPSDQYCEPTLGQCLPHPEGEECIADRKSTRLNSSHRL